jgi:hypothetical protein
MLQIWDQRRIVPIAALANQLGHYGIADQTPTASQGNVTLRDRHETKVRQASKCRIEDHKRIGAARLFIADSDPQYFCITLNTSRSPVAARSEQNRSTEPLEA